VAVAGVVDNDVKLAEVLGGPPDGGEVGVEVGDVELDRQEGVAVVLDEIVEDVEFTGGAGDVITSFESGFRPLAAEALRCTSDEPGLGQDDSRLHELPGSYEHIIHTLMPVCRVDRQA
jgi:hypothetical protein